MSASLSWPHVQRSTLPQNSMGSDPFPKPPKLLGMSGGPTLSRTRGLHFNPGREAKSGFRRPIFSRGRVGEASVSVFGGISGKRSLRE